MPLASIDVAPMKVPLNKIDHTTGDSLACDRRQVYKYQEPLVVRIYQTRLSDIVE